MQKMLRFDMYGSVEVPADFPIGLQYNNTGRKVGEFVFQVEASDLLELGSISRLSFECALSADQAWLDDRGYQAAAPVRGPG